MGFLEFRFTPLHRIRHQILCRRQGDRALPKRIRFCARGGWERAAYFPRAGDPPEPRPSFRRAETGFFDAVGEECRAVRERVGILDLGGFTKLIVEGAAAEPWLDRLVCGRLPRQGRIALTWTLNNKGGILSEFTITRLAPARFLLISAAAAEWHDLDGLRQHLPAG